MGRVAILVAVATAGALAFALWPVCVPLAADQVASMQPPIAERTDADFFVRVFQQRRDGWYQCKTRVSRALFF